MEAFAGFRRAAIGGIPVLWLRDARFKTFRVALFARRTLDARAAARALLPGLLLQGTVRDPDRPALTRRMQDLFGASAHPSTAKLGESHVLVFALDTVSGRCLPGRPDQLRGGLELLADLLARPRLERDAFPHDVFERERTQAANAIKALADDKSAFAFERAIASACAGEPMATPEHGGLEAVLALAAQDPERARVDFLTHGECWLVAMGDLPDDAELQDRVARFLGELPARAAEPVAQPRVVAEREPRRTVETTELQQSKLVMVLRAPRITDVATRVGRALFVSMLGGGPSSRLFAEVREKRSLAYYASASADKHKGLVIVQVGLDARAVEAVEAEVLRQLDELQAGRFEDKELEIARKLLLASLDSIDDSIAQRMRFTSEQWLLGDDRAPDAMAAVARAAGRDDALRGGAGIWLDHIYLLRDRGTTDAAP